MKKYETESILKTLLMSFGCFAIAIVAMLIITSFNIEVANEAIVVIAIIFIASLYSILESLFIFIDDCIYKFSAICG